MIGLAALQAAGWAAGTVLGWRLPTPPPAPGGPSGRAAVSVIVPARDEAARLPRLLASLAAQDVPAAEVIVVDDGSTDGTADIAAAAGATVVRSGALPPGWAGKAWACHLGAAAAGGGVLAFLDADTWLAPDGLARLLAAHRALAPDGLLSVQPYHVTEEPYEQLSAFANAVAVLASGAAALRPARSCAVAFGPCLVTTPAALAAAGGFEAVRGSTVEDIAMARAYRAAGRAVRCLGGGATVRFRMYADGPAALVQGWTKNLAAGARRAAPLPLAGTVAWVAGAASAGVQVVAAPSAWALVAYAAFALQVAWLLRRIGSFRWWTSALFPLPLAAFVALFARSVVARGLRRNVKWRGRRVEVVAG